MARFSMRIVDADFYLAKPIKGIDICFSEFRQNEPQRIPVLRIYGSTASGQKTCLHLHQTFPYIYVQVPERDATHKFAKQFASSLDLAIQISLGKPVSNVQNYVHDVSAVNGITFYGFHDKEEHFLKISLYNPNLVKKVEEILLNGSIMNRAFQPYEGHIPYLLQFFIDYNLYGMNFIHLTNVKFRQPVFFSGDFVTDDKKAIMSPTLFKRKKSTVTSPLSSPSQTCYDTWHPDDLSEEMLVPDTIKRQSTCLLEVDAIASDILNRKEVKESLGTCPGLASIWEEEKQRRRLNNESTDIAPPKSQEQRQTVIHHTEQNFLEDFKAILEERRQRSLQMKSSESSDSPDLDSPNLISDDGKTPELELPFVNVDLDESLPIVDEDSIRHSLCQSSYPDQSTPPASQVLTSTLDNQLVDILADLGETPDASLSLASSLTNGIEEEGENLGSIEQLQEDDMNETIMMSQHVFDDIEGVGQNEEDAINIEDNDNNENIGANDDEILEQGFEDSWGDSLLNDIPQMDGTFDIEDVVHNKCKGITASAKRQTKVDSNSMALEASGSQQNIRNIVPCNCHRVSSAKIGDKKLQDFEILQVDGSSDSDFWGYDPNLRSKGKKIPLRKLGTSAGKRIRSSKNVKKKQVEAQGCLERKDEDIEIERSNAQSTEIIETPACETKEHFKAKMDHVENDGMGNEKSVSGEISRNNTVTEESKEEKESIFSNPRSFSNSSVNSEDGGIMSPKAFYSKAKHLSLPKITSSKVNKRKRLSLKPLEFAGTSSSHKGLSKSRKTRLALSDSKSKRISFTEIVSDFSNVSQNIPKSEDRGHVEARLKNASSKSEHHQSSERVSKVEISCRPVVPNRSDQRSKKEEVISSSSARNIASYPKKEEDFPALSPVRKSNTKYRIKNSKHSNQPSHQLGSPLSAQNVTPENQSEEGASSFARRGSPEDTKSLCGVVRECYVGLFDIHSKRTASMRAESSSSKKRKPRFPKQSFSKRMRLESNKHKHSTRYIDKDCWGSNGGIMLRSADSCSPDVCTTCYDSLFKASFASPKRVDSPTSPPRVNSPTEDLSHITLPASSLNEVASCSAAKSAAAEATVENQDPHDVKIRFQNDRFCAHIKPVRLNFDAESKELATGGSEMVNKGDLHRTKRMSQQSFKGRDRADCLSTISEPLEHVSSTSEVVEEDADNYLTSTLVSVDSSQSYDYCIKFSPVIDDLTSSAKQKKVGSSSRWKKRLGLGRLLASKKHIKPSHDETFNVPSVGDATQSEILPQDELEDNENRSSCKDPSIFESGKTDSMQKRADFNVTAKKYGNATIDLDPPLQDNRVSKQNCAVEQELSSAHLKDSDRNSRAAASFAVIESREIILADDSVIITPKEKIACSTSSSEQPAQDRTVLDTEDRENLESVKSIFNESEHDDATDNDGYILQLKKTGKGDSVRRDDIVDREITRTTSRNDGVTSLAKDSPGGLTGFSFRSMENQKEADRHLDSSQFRKSPAAEGSMIRHSLVRSFATTDTPHQDILPSSSLKDSSTRQKQTVFAKAPQSCQNITKQPSVIFTPLRKPPSRAKVLESAKLYGLGETRHQKAFFSNPMDLPARTSVVGGHRLRIKSAQVCKLPLFDTESGFQHSLERYQSEQLMNTSLYQDLYNQAAILDMNKAELNRFLASDTKIVLTPCKKPPKQSAVKLWLEKKLAKEEKEKVKFNNRRDSELKSPNTTEVQGADNQANSSLFKSPGGPKEQAYKVSSKQRSSQVTRSPQFSPAVASSNSMLATSPVSSTPLTTARKPPSHVQLSSRIAGKSRHGCGSPATTPIQLKRTTSDSSDLEGPTPKNTFGFGFTQVNYDNARNDHQIQHLTILSMELHVRTRRDLCPDPGFDPICAIFYHMTCETYDSKETGIFFVEPHSSDKNDAKDLAANVKDTKDNSETSGVPSCSNMAGQDTCTATSRNFLNKSGVSDHVQRYYDDEKTMIMAFQSFVQSHDPDMIVGYEIQMLSWGYLIDRAKELDVILCPLLSRVPTVNTVSKLNDDSEKEAIFYGHVNDFKITGRILLNLWRVMRSEVTLRVYSFENVAFHVLHQRLPKYSFRTLSSWWGHQSSLHRWRVVEYYVKRCRANLEMLIRTDFIDRTSELARLFGILFYSVISRGSQFRVESMMLRIAKPLGYIPVSPSTRQRAVMAAPEVIPLVMEPESRFYPDPVIVLDFQSLYPSIIIAYNYCFSTCLGRVKHWNELGSFKFGATSLTIPTSVFEGIKDHIHISPNGVGFVKQNIRRGILPRMLDDILKTRIMVKNSMKKNKQNKALYRMLDARQLGLKLIANVTYGYTSASYSGRMPCVEIADSVVRKAREALETVISLINSTEKWNARVVYGDTDSVFILMKGATKKRAFEVGYEIVDAVTKMNPQPMKLKFEKVYMPCILQTKKRYVGYMYESLDQKEPVFDAKGIETVRRDSCAAVSKILERSLKVLFETKDLSLVKKYVERQFTKIMEDRVSIQDFTFAKEYRGMRNYRPGACVPALSIARRLLAFDKRAEPRPGERVPYVIVYGTPGLPLIQLVKRPCELMEDSNLRLNGSYYITKQIIPSLNRAFSLIGVDILEWYNELPRPQRKIRRQEPLTGKKKKGTISQYFSSTHCPICGELTRGNICGDCKSDPQRAVTILSSRVMYCERKFAHLSELCCHCTGTRDQIEKCISQDCPVLHKLYHIKTDLATVSTYRRILDEIT